MAGKATVELKGKDDVRKAFQNLERSVLREVKAITRETADEIRREARSRIPVSTVGGAKGKSRTNKYPPGSTREKVRRFISKDGLAAYVFNKWFVARFLEHGTVKMSARPWLFPAFEVVRPKYLQRIQSAIYGVTRSMR